MKYEMLTEQGVNVVTLSGPIDAEVTPLFHDIIRTSTTSELVLDCDGIGRINSIGIKSWIFGLEALAATRQVSLGRCPLAMLEVAAMIPSFLGRHDIKSMYLNFVCEKCEHEAMFLVPTTDRKPQLPSGLTCPQCESSLACDEDTAELLSLVFASAKRPGLSA